MSEPFIPQKALPFTAILYRSDLLSLEDCFSEVERSLFKGEVFDLSEEQFNLVNYYEKEMGQKEDLRRAFVFSNSLCERSDLVALKLASNKIEESLRKKWGQKGRVLNLDPGYLALEQVVLATGKPYSHRIYLDHGIYAELTFQYQQGKWTELPWTYPDYQQECVKNLFEEQRNLLKGPLK